MKSMLSYLHAVVCMFFIDPFAKVSRQPDGNLHVTFYR